MNFCRIWPVLLLVTIFLVSGEGRAWSADPRKVRSPCKIRYPSDKKVAWECARMRPGETLEDLFGDRWRDVARFNRIDRRHAEQGVRIKVPLQLEDIKNFTPMPLEYLEADAKFILVDLSEQFLGAYEYGRLVFSVPMVTGEKGNETPIGEFRVTAVDRSHRSSLYFIEKTSIPYPMNYGLRFYVNKRGISFWIHGRDVPGYPASHGCIGLYDEAMQKKYYKYPGNPVLDDARILYEWVIAPLSDEEGFRVLKEGPRVLIVGEAP